MRKFLHFATLTICAILMTTNASAQTDYFVRPSSGYDYGTWKFSYWYSVETDEFPAVVSVMATDSNGNEVNAISQYNDNAV